MTLPREQICILHGGEAYASDADYRQALEDKMLLYERLLYAPSWKKWLAEQLTGSDVLLPSLPNPQNAKYDEWALYFSKVMPLLAPGATLIGHSLGGIFLAKYLSEHPPARPFARLILVAAPYDDESTESLGGFKLTNASRLQSAAREIHLFFSDDDPVVPLEEKNKYLRDIPSAILHQLSGKQHFNDPTFPELLALLS